MMALLSGPHHYTLQTHTTPLLPCSGHHMRPLRSYGKRNHHGGHQIGRTWLTHTVATTLASTGCSKAIHKSAFGVPDSQEPSRALCARSSLSDRPIRCTCLAQCTGRPLWSLNCSLGHVQDVHMPALERNKRGMARCSEVHLIECEGAIKLHHRPCRPYT